MAETRKPATTTRKKTTRRGPTKAAALKALGLTQEDLNILKQVAAAREEAAAYASGETKSVDLQPIEELPQPVNQPDPDAQTPNNWFVRNLRYVQVGFRLTRQQDTKTKRTDLKPRGQRGDLAKLKEEDLQDDELLRQVNLGVVEIIPFGEAKKVLEGQATNQQQQGNPLHDALRNELGKPYDAGAIKLEPSYEDQGIVVAQLTPQGGEAGAIASQGRGVDWQAARNIGGNPAIISDGFNPPDAAAQADARARQKNVEGPAAGLAEGIKVVVEPTRRG